MIVINPLSYALSLYDVCVQTKSSNVCRDYVSGVIPSVVDTILGTYEACKQALPGDTCKNIISTQKTDITNTLLFIGIGFLLGKIIR